MINYQKERLDSVHKIMYDYIIREESEIVEKLKIAQKDLAEESSYEEADLSIYVEDLEKIPGILSELKERMKKVKDLEPKEQIEELTKIIKKFDYYIIQTYNSNPDRFAPNDETALAWVQDHETLLDLIRDYNMNEENNKIDALNTKLQNAIAQANLNEVKEALEEGADIEHRYPSGRTPISHALESIGIFSSHPPDRGACRDSKQINLKRIVELLILKNANINAISTSGFSPLMLAVSSGDAGLVEMLIQNGAFLSFKSYEGITAMHLVNCAMFQPIERMVEVLRMLIKHNAPLDERDSEGDTPLIQAVEIGNYRIAKELLVAGANIDIRNNYYVNAWNMAFYWQDGNLLKLLDQYSPHPILSSKQTNPMTAEERASKTKEVEEMYNNNKHNRKDLVENYRENLAQHSYQSKLKD